MSDREGTRDEDRDEDRPTMKDVSHTPPHQTSAEAVWERGPAAGDESPSPADD